MAPALVAGSKEVVVFPPHILQKKREENGGGGGGGTRETEVDWSRVKNPVFIIIINNHGINKKNGVALVNVGPVHSRHVVV